MRIVLPRLIWPRSRALMMPWVSVWLRPKDCRWPAPTDRLDILAVTQDHGGQVAAARPGAAKAMSIPDRFQTWIGCKICRLPGLIVIWFGAARATTWYVRKHKDALLIGELRKHARPGLLLVPGPRFRARPFGGAAWWGQSHHRQKPSSSPTQSSRSTSPDLYSRAASMALAEATAG